MKASSPKHSPLRLAVLISGSGTTLENLAVQIAQGKLPAKIQRVIASRPDIYGLQRADKLGLPHVVVNRRGFTSVRAFSTAINRALDQYPVDLVCMAGFLSLWEIPTEFSNRVMNIHPALLPKFGGKGMHGLTVHQAVIDAGEKRSGCTVHFADNQYDHGPIILQRTCSVKDNDTADTLAARVFKQECIAYPEAIRLFADGRIRVTDHFVHILPEK
ncbi:MAG TPA: phosphoribosylglycinamide formyltransferase [Phycisphaerae bacterium]|nr:phosphoribosylglycinamide formyltransferase [Phycisphaerae bacterium]